MYYTLSLLLERYKDRDNPFEKKVTLRFSQDSEVSVDSSPHLFEWLDSSSTLEVGHQHYRLLQGKWYEVKEDTHAAKKKVLEKKIIDHSLLPLPNFDGARDFKIVFPSAKKKKAEAGAGEEEAKDDDENEHVIADAQEQIDEENDSEHDDEDFPAAAAGSTPVDEKKKGIKRLDEGVYNLRAYQELLALNRPGRFIYHLDAKNIYVITKEDKFEFSDLLVIDSEEDGAYKSYIIHVKRSWERDPISTLLSQGRVSALLLTDDFTMPKRVINKIIRLEVKKYFSELNPTIKVSAGTYETVEKKGKEAAVRIDTQLTAKVLQPKSKSDPRRAERELLTKVRAMFFGDRTGVLEVASQPKYLKMLLGIPDIMAQIDELHGMINHHRTLLTSVFSKGNLKNMMVVFVVINEQNDRTLNLHHFTAHDFYESMLRIEKAGMQFGLMAVGSEPRKKSSSK